DDRRGPGAGAAGEAVFEVFAVVVDRARRLSELCAVVEAVGIDRGAQPRRGVADRADIDAAAPAQEELGGAGAEAVRLDQRPILGPDFDRALRVASCARVVGAAERTAAGPYPNF